MHLTDDRFDSVRITSGSVLLKYFFEPDVSHYDVIVVVVIMELFANVVFNVAMLLLMILVLSQ